MQSWVHIPENSDLAQELVRLFREVELRQILAHKNVTLNPWFKQLIDRKAKQLKIHTVR